MIDRLGLGPGFVIMFWMFMGIVSIFCLYIYYIAYYEWIKNTASDVMDWIVDRIGGLRRKWKRRKEKENMYESPINQIFGEIQTAYENECLKAVQSVGFDVNKEELIKALMYDRNQYEKGFNDGYKKAIDDLESSMELWNDSIETIRSQIKQLKEVGYGS